MANLLLLKKILDSETGAQRSKSCPRPWRSHLSLLKTSCRGLSVQSPRCLRKGGRVCSSDFPPCHQEAVSYWLPPGGPACTVTTIFLLLCFLAWTSVVLTTSAYKSCPRVQGGFTGEHRSLRLAAKPLPWLHEGVITTVCACWRASTPASVSRLCA